MPEHDSVGSKPQISAFAGDMNFVVAFLRAGGPVSYADASGSTMLHAAVSGWQHKMAELLVLYDADVNAQDHNGDTPLHCLVRAKDTPLEGTFLCGEAPEEARHKTFFLLLLKKADTSIQNKQGVGALHLAAYSGDLAAIKELTLGYKVSLEDTSASGVTALGYAILNEHLDCAQYLIKAGASIDAKLPNGPPLRNLLTFTNEPGSAETDT